MPLQGVGLELSGQRSLSAQDLLDSTDALGGSRVFTQGRYPCQGHFRGPCKPPPIVPET